MLDNLYTQAQGHFYGGKENRNTEQHRNQKENVLELLLCTDCVSPVCLLDSAEHVTVKGAESKS